MVAPNSARQNRETSCPECGHTIKSSATGRSKRVQCPKCRGVIDLRAPGAAPTDEPTGPRYHPACHGETTVTTRLSSDVVLTPSGSSWRPGQRPRRCSSGGSEVMASSTPCTHAIPACSGPPASLQFVTTCTEGVVLMRRLPWHLSGVRSERQRLLCRLGAGDLLVKQAPHAFFGISVG